MFIEIVFTLALNLSRNITCKIYTLLPYFNIWQNKVIRLARLLTTGY